MQSMSDYYSAVQLRSDHWSALRESLATLAGDPKGRHAKATRQKINRVFDSLEFIETYWAFPGIAVFDHMRRQFELGKIEDVAFSASRIARALTSGAYRRRTIPLGSRIG